MEQIDAAGHLTRRLGVWGNTISAVVFLVGGTVFAVDTVVRLANDDSFVRSLLLSAVAISLGVVAVRSARRGRRSLSEVEVV